MATKKRGLGLGLDALISDNNEEKLVVENTGEPLLIKINKIEPIKNQPRQHFDEDALIELSESIKQYGIIQPLLVNKREDYYEIVAGERRWRAAKLAGLKEVPVIMKGLTAIEVLEISLIENLQRENLNAIEEAIAYKRLIDEFSLKQDEIAEKVSKSRTAVTNTLRLMGLDPRGKNMIVNDMISGGHGRALLGIEQGDLQFETAERVFDEKLSVRETENLVRQLLKPVVDKQKPIPSIDPIYKEISNRFEEKLGTKVKINTKNNRTGKIEIEYYSSDDLERLMRLFDTIQE